MARRRRRNPSPDFAPVRAKARDPLDEPRLAIRAAPLTFVVGGVLAGMVGGWILSKAIAAAPTTTITV